MRALLLFLVAILLATPVLSYSIISYSAVYEISDRWATADIKLTLNEPTSTFEWTIPSDSQDIEIEGLNFELISLRESKKLRISGGEFDKVNIRYLTSSVIERTKDSFFILDFSEAKTAKKSIKVMLPEKATLKYPTSSQKSSLIPPTGKVYTDGIRMIASWEDNELNGANSVLIIFNEDSSNGTISLLLLVSAAIAAGILFFFYAKKSTRLKRKQEGQPEITRNLFEDEKKLVEVLISCKEKEMWQKQLQIKSGLSKVKLSRKLRALEQKGIIEKIPYGNTNKIRLKK